MDKVSTPGQQIGSNGDTLMASTDIGVHQTHESDITIFKESQPLRYVWFESSTEYLSRNMDYSRLAFR